MIMSLRFCLHWGGLAGWAAAPSYWYHVGTYFLCLFRNWEKRSVAPAKDKDQIEMEGVVFDPDRCVACNVEHGHTVAHGSGGRGYGLASTPMTSGCYQWKVSLLLLIFFNYKKMTRRRKHIQTNRKKGMDLCKCKQV